MRKPSHLVVEEIHGTKIPMSAVRYRYQDWKARLNNGCGSSTASGTSLDSAMISLIGAKLVRRNTTYLSSESNGARRAIA